MTRERWILLGVVLLVLAALAWRAQEREPANDLRPEPAEPATPGAPVLTSRPLPPVPKPKPVFAPAPTPSPTSNPVPKPQPAPSSLINKITGRVVNAFGDPVGRMAMRVKGGGWWYATPEGRFELSVPRPGTYTILGTAAGSFHARVEHEVTTDNRGAASNVRVVVPADHSLHGVALLPDGRPASGVLIKVAPTHADGNDLGYLAEGIWSMLDGRSWLASRTDEDGVFGFGGVDPRSTYKLWWIGDDGEPTCHPEPVRAGQDKVQIEIARHRLRLRVTSSNPDVPFEPEITIRTPDLLPTSESSRFSFEKPFNRGSHWDEPTFVAPAGTRLRVTVFAPGHAHFDRPYVIKETYGTQVLPIELKHLSACATLDVEVRDPEGRVLPEAVIRKTYVDSAGAEVADVATTRIPPCRLRVRTTGFRGVTRWDDPRLLLLPATATVDVPRSGTKRVQLDVERGGSVELQFLEPEKRGAYQDSFFLDYVLRDDVGRPVDVVWYRPDGTTSGTLISEPRRSTVLRPGHYELTLSPGFAGHELKPITVPISIEQGRVTKQPVQLVHQPLKR